MVDLFITKPGSNDFAFHYYRNMPVGVLLSKDIERINDTIASHSCVWLEWANEITEQVSQTRHSAKIVVRVHDHEIYMGRASRVNWNNVDAIWFINRCAMEDFKKHIGEPCKMFFLPNAVDTSLYTFSPVKQKRIALNTLYCRPRKRIDRAIDLIKEINKVDPEWELIIRADLSKFEEEYESLMKKAHATNTGFDNRPVDFKAYQTQKGDISAFFADKAVTLSTSEHEGFHYAIGEGMACGCRPGVFDWEWGKAKDFWEPFVFPTTKHMAEDILQMNLSEAQHYRDMVEERFSPQVLIPQLNEKLIQSLNT